MTDFVDVPQPIVERVRVACALLPEAHEEPSYAGLRWRIRTRTLAELVTVDGDGDDGPTTTITVHARPEELDALVATGDPFRAGWGPGLVAMVLRDDGTTDWDEVRELVTDSYALLAPKKLVARLDLPPS